MMMRAVLGAAGFLLALSLTLGAEAAEMTRATASAPLRSRLGAVKRCYRNHLRGAPEDFGTFTVLFTVDPSGAVLESWLEIGSFPDENLQACVLNAFRGVTFPAASKASIVRTTLFLSSELSPEERVKVVKDRLRHTPATETTTSTPKDETWVY